MHGPEAPQRLATKGRSSKKLNIRLTFEENYELTNTILGAGTYGEVRVCQSLEGTQKDYAVKIVLKSSPYFFRARVLREIETFYICREHDNIIHFLHYFEEPMGFYLIFEKIEGGPLFDHIRRRNYLNENEASNIVSDLAKALSFLHDKGIAHRDLKPENVLCTRIDSPCPVKLGDFDLCSQITNSTTPKLLTPVGSLEYMAPEVLKTFTPSDDDDDDDVTDAEGIPSYDKKCDLWSLGVLTYVLLSGVPPFVGNCDRDTCGWDEGESCSDCQRNLTSSIRSGVINFSEDAWKKVSHNAIDLVSRLLIKDAEKRLSAAALLNHSWITGRGSSNCLPTPTVLRRINSLKDISMFTSSTNTLRKAISGQMPERGKLPAKMKKQQQFSSIDEDIMA